METLTTTIRLPREIAADLASIAMKSGQKKNEVMVKIIKDFVEKSNGKKNVN